MLIVYTLQKSQKHNKNHNSVWFFLVYLLKLLVDWPCFYFSCSIIVLAISLMVGLAINGAVSITSKVAVGLLT